MPANSLHCPPIYAALDHRGGLDADVASLIPSGETLNCLGGRDAVARLVDRLYDRFETDSLLRPAFGRDLTRERERVKLFFEGWFGGSPEYFDADWPPGLKAAHGAVSISRNMAGRWVKHFFDSLAEVVDDPSLIRQFKPIISRLAMSLVNRTDEPCRGEKLRCSATGSDAGLLALVVHDDVAGLAAAAEQSLMTNKQASRLLLIAAVRGKVSVVEELLRQGEDVNAAVMLPGGDANSNNLPMLPITPLCGALARRREKVVEVLVEHGARYDIFTAALLGDLESIGTALNSDPGLANAPDPASDVAHITPLLHAVSGGRLEIARLLFERGAVVGANSVRLVRSAANAGHEALTDLLLKHGADPSALGPGPWVNCPSIAEKLMERGANVNVPPGAWIGWCCTGNSGHRENVALAGGMLRCGANVKAIYKGRTALHCAAKAGFVGVAAALFEYGAEANALNEWGQTPLDELSKVGKSIDVEPMRRLLVSHGALPGRR